MRKSFFLLLALVYFSFNAEAVDIHYKVEMPLPNSHYYNVKMSITGLKQKETIVKMPVWAPGSYLSREFAKNVNQVYATSKKGKLLQIEKVSKNAWKIDTKGENSIFIDYQVYAFELSVRTSFLDDSHGYINGTSVFMYMDGEKESPGKLTIVPHESFSKISTALNSTEKNTFEFKNYDQLVDCPIEIGNQHEFHFTASGVDHTVAMYGEGNYDEEVLKRDMAKIVEAETMIMGENPNKEYLFIIHNITVPSGGLEHKNSTTLQVNRWTYDGDDYLGFLSLVAHEYFHLWNVKRMRPKALGPFNYDTENYTDLLWVMEGFTSYYDELVLRRAGFYTEDDYLGKLFSTINYVENRPGNNVQPVAHASFDAWIKAYRPNENSVNTTISYYSKGQILAAMLDMHIIGKFKGKKSLDDFLQAIYAQYYKANDVGYTEAQFQEALEAFLGEDMDWFFSKYVYSSQNIDYATHFNNVGLDVSDQTKEPRSELGIQTKNSGGKLVITTVYSGSAAEKQGLSVNDEIIAVNGYRVDKGDFEQMMATQNIGDVFKVLVSRDNLLKTYKVEMGANHRIKYTYQPNFNGNSRALFDYWLRVDVK